MVWCLHLVGLCLAQQCVLRLCSSGAWSCYSRVMHFLSYRYVCCALPSSGLIPGWLATTRDSVGSFIQLRSLWVTCTWIAPALRLPAYLAGALNGMTLRCKRAAEKTASFAVFLIVFSQTNAGLFWFVAVNSHSELSAKLPREKK